MQYSASVVIGCICGVLRPGLARERQGGAPHLEGGGPGHPLPQAKEAGGPEGGRSRTRRPRPSMVPGLCARAAGERPPHQDPRSARLLHAGVPAAQSGEFVPGVRGGEGAGVALPCAWQTPGDRFRQRPRV